MKKCVHNYDVTGFLPKGNQILSGLSAKQYTEVIKMLESAILSTDLALYFKYVVINHP